MFSGDDQETQGPGRSSGAAFGPLSVVDTVGRVLAEGEFSDPDHLDECALEVLAEVYGASLTAAVKFTDSGAKVVGFWDRGRFERDVRIVVDNDLLSVEASLRTDQRPTVLAPEVFGPALATILDGIGPGQSLLVAKMVDDDVITGVIVILAPSIASLDAHSQHTMQLCAEIVWRYIRRHASRRELNERVEVAEVLAFIGRRLHEGNIDDAPGMVLEVMRTVGHHVGADLIAVDEVVGSSLVPRNEWTVDGKPTGRTPRCTPKDIERLARVRLDPFDAFTSTSLTDRLDHGLRSGFVIGFREHGKVAGVVVAGSRSDQKFLPAHTEVVIGATRLLEHFRARMNGQRALIRRGVVGEARTEIAETFLNASASQVDDAVVSALGRVASLFGARRVLWIEKGDGDHSSVVCLEWRDDALPEIALNPSVDEYFADTATPRVPTVFSPASLNEMFGMTPHWPTLVVPAIAADKVCAVLTLTADDIGREMPESERRALVDLAGLLLQARRRAGQELAAEYRQALDELHLKLATRLLERDVLDARPLIDWLVGELGLALGADIIGIAHDIGSPRGGTQWWAKDSASASVQQQWASTTDGMLRHFKETLETGEPALTRSRLLPDSTRAVVEAATGCEFSSLLVPVQAGGMGLLLGVAVLHDREWNSTERAFLQQVVGQIRQFIDVVASRGQLEYDASHDALTGLANRRKLTDELATVLDTGRHGGVLMVDIDRFKVVNDSLGHSAGDLVLVTIADRIRSSVRDGDLVCRFGGDEFAVLVTDGLDDLQLAAAADRLISVIREPISVRGTTVIPTCSVGIAVSRQNDDVEAVLRHADAALYDAKAKGRDRYEFFDEAHRQSLRERLSLETRLRRALLANEFLAWYQPEYDLERNEIAGVEALVRWDHPTDGMLDAARFIDTAEEIGLAPELSRLVMRRGFETLQQWNEIGFTTRMRINVAAAQLQSSTS